MKKPTPSSLPAIIFDFGGVLMDWDPFYLFDKLFAGERQAAEQFIREIDFYSWNLEQDRGRSWRAAVQSHCAKFPQYCEQISAYDLRWRESLGEPLWETVDVLAELRAAGYPLSGLSNWSAEKFDLVRPDYPFFDWFADIVISGKVGMIKPEKPIFALTLERIGRAADECVLIDDSRQNIATAREMGFTTLHFDSPERLRRELAVLQLLPAGRNGNEQT